MRYIQVVFVHIMSKYGDIALESGNGILLRVKKKASDFNGLQTCEGKKVMTYVII